MPSLILSDKDIEIFKFLWKWKLGTTKLVQLRFYGDSNGQGAYFRLWRLAKAGFVTAKSDENRRHSYWILTDKGFGVLKHELDSLVQIGYKSENYRHDFLTTVIHLGCWITSQPKNVTLFSEQELRRVDPKCLPSWLPNTSIHRPDGYWHIQDSTGEQLIALEVELSKKPTEEYERLAHFYKQESRITQVIWVVKKPTDLASIHKAISTHLTADKYIHSYLLLSDVLNNHWQAIIHNGKHQGKSLTESIAKLPQNPCKTFCGADFFNTQKFLINSASKQNLESSKIFD